MIRFTLDILRNGIGLFISVSITNSIFYIKFFLIPVGSLKGIYVNSSVIFFIRYSSKIFKMSTIVLSNLQNCHYENVKLLYLFIETKSGTYCWNIGTTCISNESICFKEQENNKKNLWRYFFKHHSKKKENFMN